MSHRANLQVVITAAALALSACSGSGSSASTAAPTTTPSGSTTTVVATPAPTTTSSTSSASMGPTTTMQADTTVPVTITTESPASTTTATPTSTSLPDGVPPRVTFPDDPERQAVVDAVYAYFDAIASASADPTNSNERQQFLETVGEPLAVRVTAFLDELVSRGERIVASETQPSFIEIFAFTVEMLDDSATLDACLVDSDVRVAVGHAADGSDQVVDDTVVTSFQTISLVRIHDVWRVSDIEEFGRTEREAACD